MGSTKAALQPGDIFAIPLFLPSFQEWRKLDELIDYRKYEFPAGDPYVFGRLIEHQPGNMDLVEVFSYFGPVPEGPEVILQSGQMFAPVMLACPSARPLCPFSGRGCTAGRELCKIRYAGQRL